MSCKSIKLRCKRSSIWSQTKNVCFLLYSHGRRLMKITLIKCLGLFGDFFLRLQLCFHLYEPCLHQVIVVKQVLVSWDLLRAYQRLSDFQIDLETLYIVRTVLTSGAHTALNRYVSTQYSSEILQKHFFLLFFKSKVLSSQIPRLKASMGPPVKNSSLQRSFLSFLCNSMTCW